MNNPYKSEDTLNKCIKEATLRVTGQIKNINFWSYFITGIVIFGGCGIWFEIGNLITSDNTNLKALSTAIIFYVATLLGGTCSQVLLDKTIQDEDIRSGTWLIIVILYTCTAFLIFTQNSLPAISFLILSITLCIETLFVAWLVNSFNLGLTGNNDIDAPTGGPLLTNGGSSNNTTNPVKDNDKNPLAGDFSNLKDF